MKKITKLAAAALGVSAIAAPVITTSACSTVKWVDLTTTTAPTARMLQNSLPTNPARLSDINSAYFNAISKNSRLWYDEVLWQNNPLKTMSLTEYEITTATTRGAVWNLKVTNGNRISFKFRYEYERKEGELRDYTNIDVSFTNFPVRIVGYERNEGEWQYGMGPAKNTEYFNDWTMKINNFESLYQLYRPKLETISVTSVGLIEVKNKTINSKNMENLSLDESYAIEEIAARVFLNDILFLEDIISISDK